jgi:hypothetical protein
VDEDAMSADGAESDGAARQLLRRATRSLLRLTGGVRDRVPPDEREAANEDGAAPPPPLPPPPLDASA